MSTIFGRWARHGLYQAIASAVAEGDTETDFRSAICRFEDDLFADYPAGHARIECREARAMVSEIFTTLGCRAPKIALVPGFTDPRVGGFADIANHRISIERGHLYRFLVLHEAAHLIVPEDRLHGPAFTFVAQLLYQSFVAIPEEAIRARLARHGLPLFTGSTARLAA